MRFPDTVSVAKKVSTDANHLTTYGTATTVKCNLQYGSQVIKTPEGNHVVSSAWIAFPPGTSILKTDKITLPDNTSPEITSVAPKKNDITKRVHYIEVYLTASKPAGSIV